MRHALSLIVPALLLAACGNDTDTTTIKGPDGESVTIERPKDGDGEMRLEATNDKGQKSTATFAGEGAAWPADAPTHAPAYPGAKVVAVMESDSDGTKGSVITFETADSPAKVVAHYKTLAEKAGMGEFGTVAAGTMQMFTASDKASGREIMVQASTSDGATQGSITYATRAGG
jgi:hypothetical protein